MKLSLFFLNGMCPMSVITQPPDNPKSHKVSKPPTIKFSGALLCEQLLNSFIIAGIAAISTLAATGQGEVTAKAAGISFGLTFLIELRKYRHL
jgi:hypothetical protein